MKKQEKNEAGKGDDKVIMKRTDDIKAVGKIFQNKIGKWQVFLYFDKENKDKIGFSHNDREAVEKLVKSAKENHCEFNVNESGYITTYCVVMPKNKTEQDTAKDVEDNEPNEPQIHVEYEQNTENRIAISWSINAVLQYAQIHSGEVWTWDRIINEAKILREKAYKSI